MVCKCVSFFRRQETEVVFTGATIGFLPAEWDRQFQEVDLFSQPTWDIWDNERELVSKNGYTFVYSNMAMEHILFIGYFRITTSIYGGFSSKPCLMTPEGIPAASLLERWVNLGPPHQSWLDHRAGEDAATMAAWRVGNDVMVRMGHTDTRSNVWGGQNMPTFPNIRKSCSISFQYYCTLEKPTDKLS